MPPPNYIITAEYKLKEVAYGELSKILSKHLFLSYYGDCERSKKPMIPNPHIESRQSFSWIKSMLLLLAKQNILNFQVIFSFSHLNFECFVLITIKHRFLDGSLL